MYINYRIPSDDLFHFLSNKKLLVKINIHGGFGISKNMHEGHV